MEEIQISKFKATCLAVLDRVGKTRKPLLVTRFGKPIDQVLPPPSPGGNWLGKMKDQGEVRGDLVAPVTNSMDWEALKQMGLLLDTHIWLWSLLDPDRLGGTTAHALQSQENALQISPISVWEALLLAERGQVALDPDPFRCLRQAMSIAPIAEAPLTVDAALASRTVDVEH